MRSMARKIAKKEYSDTHWQLVLCWSFTAQEYPWIKIFQ